MVNEIAKMGPMNLPLVHHVNAEQEHSSARTATVHHQQLSAMALMTAEMVQTNKTVTCHVQNSSSSVAQTVAAFSTAGNVTVTQTAKTGLMKTLPYVINVPVTQTQNSHAKMDVASRNCGCATLITTAVMIPMSRRTCADTGTAPKDGNVALVVLTTDAFRNGCSVMERTIVVTIPMNLRRIVPSAIPILISCVLIIVVCLNSGSAILQTIVVMVLTKLKPYARVITESVRSPSSSATMASVFQQGGDATTRMIVEIIQMKLAAVTSSARMEPSSVLQDIVLQPISGKLL